MMAAPIITPHWKFNELVDGLYDAIPVSRQEVTGLALDSRNVRAGDLFFACGGSQAHGEHYIDQAIAQGAVVVMLEAAESGVEQRSEVAVYRVPALRKMIGPIAERFYGSPSKKLYMVGVTGTNGKTSISQFIAHGFQDDAPCGLIGTLGNGLYGELQPATHTTPDAIALHGLLMELRDKGVRNVVMEVSSHGLEQSRVAGVNFDVAVFSNLSHEHLDYHGDMASYGRAKQQLFLTPGLKYAVVNSDDEFGRSILGSLDESINAVSYGLDAQFSPMLLASDLQLDAAGLHMRISSPWGQGELHAPLLGRFNVSNLLAALAVLLVSDVSLPDALQRLSRVQPVAGRMQSLGGESGQPLVVVDYAHTPDALFQVLHAVRAHTQGKVWCVFGCGGDRDKAKRPLMASLSQQLADRTVVTDDNPRTENSADIIADILQGFTTTREHVQVIADRATAIAETIAMAEAGDLVLIAGKGHEDFQLIGTQRLNFSDVEEVHRALGMRGGRNQ